jgi:UDP-3-O-[3-hydroxymyristoyl] glucosamine N-acyltransferase
VIDPRAVVSPKAELAADVTVGPFSIIGPDVILGPGTVIGPHAVINGPTRMGANNRVHQFASIGDTVLEEGVKLDNQIQIGHNCQIGAHTAMAACVGLSGSVTVGKRCMIGGMVGIVGHLSICDDVAVTGLTMVSHPITQPGVYSGGIPAEEARAWRRIVGRLKRIDSMASRLAALERATGTQPAPDMDDDPNATNKPQGEDDD